MKFKVYIYGNYVGAAIAQRVDIRIHIFWDRGVRESVEQVNAFDSCVAAMKELLNDTMYSFATFGDGVGELKVV